MTTPNQKFTVDYDDKGRTDPLHETTTRGQQKKGMVDVYYGFVVVDVRR